MPIKLDNIDRHILSLLQSNARISNAELAEEVNLSPTPCLRRLRKLEDSGLIRNYTAVLNEKELGFLVSAYVWVNLEKNTKENGQAFESAIRLLPEVVECCVVAGRHDYVLKVVTTSLEDYDRFMKESLAEVKPVADLESMIILNQSMVGGGLPLNLA
jgi:Lrp/AsnC family leucine-responsive transcriptional regulator